MATPEVKKLQVYYKDTAVKKNLTADLAFRIPQNSDLENPDGSIGPTFDMTPPGGSTNIYMYFTELQDSAGRSSTYKDVQRKGMITLNQAFSQKQQTIARLMNPDGQQESKKSQTAAQYQEDPSEGTGGIE
jgi:hypothetical protein